MTKLMICVLVAVSSLASVAQDGKPNGSEPPITIEREINLVDAGISGRSLIRGVGDLGVLKPDTLYEVKLKLMNDSSENISFEEAETGCACRSVKMAKSEFLSKKVNTGTFVFKTPKDFGLDKYYTGVEFKENRKVVCTVSLNAKLSGNLSLKVNQIAMKSGDESVSSFVGFVFTEPIRKSDLSLEIDKTLAPHIQAKIEFPADQAGNGKIKVSTVPNSIKTRSRAVLGEILLKDKRLGKNQKVTVVIQNELPLSISPKYLDFVKNTEDEAILTATSILKISKRVKRDDEPKKGRVSLACSVSGEHVSVKMKRLTENIYRVSFNIPKKILSEIDRSDLSESKKLFCF